LKKDEKSRLIARMNKEFKNQGMEIKGKYGSLSQAKYEEWAIMFSRNVRN